MNRLPAYGAGHDLHRPAGIITPLAYADVADAAIAGWEEGCVPGTESCFGQWVLKIGGGIQYQLDDAFDMAICGCQCADIDAQPAGDG